eukprot:scaffold117435_cov71-Phaeocystis_antarctica.AAC.5
MARAAARAGGVVRAFNPGSARRYARYAPKFRGQAFREEDSNAPKANTRPHRHTAARESERGRVGGGIHSSVAIPPWVAVPAGSAAVALLGRGLLPRLVAPIDR